MTNNRRLAAELAVLLAIGTAVWAKAAPAQRGAAAVVRAPRSEVVGKDGKVRAELSVDRNELPVLRLRHRRGKARAELWLTANGSPSAWLYDASGGTRAVLDGDDTSSGLNIYSTSRKTPEGIFYRSIGMEVFRCQEASFTVWDGGFNPNGHVASGKARVNLGVAKQGHAQLSLMDGQTPARFGAYVPPGRPPVAQIYDATNKSVWSAPTTGKE